jgi:hypothetical protein
VSSCSSHVDRLAPSAAAAGDAVQQLCSWFHTLGMNSGSATSRNMLEESNKKIIKIVTFFNSPLCRVARHVEVMHYISLKSGLSKDRFAAGFLMAKEISPEDS